MRSLFFLAQRALISLMGDRRSVSAREILPWVLPDGVEVVMESRANPRDLLVSSITRNERNHIYIYYVASSAY